MELREQGTIFSLITVLLSSVSGAPTISVDANPSNYGNTETLKCTDATYNSGDGYYWQKQGVTIFNNLGEISTTGKYSESIDGTTFKLLINNIDVNDEGPYTCNHKFADSISLNLEVESRGNITAELLSSKYLEVTFKQIYPNTDITTITCDSTTVVGHFKSSVADGDRFINTWRSNDTLTTKPSSCSASVTLRTTFNTALTVTSAPTPTPEPDCRICWTGCKDWGKVLCILVCIIIILLALLVVGIIAGMVVEAICHIWERMSKKKRIASICALLFGLGLFLLYKLIRRIAAANKPGGNDSTNNSSDDIPLNKNQSHVMNTKYGKTRTLSTVEGGKVTLSCPFPESVTYPEWRGPTKLMLYTKMNDQSGEINSNAPAFERLQYASNKRDLILSNAVTSDSGDYTCSYTGQGNHTIVLKVNPANCTGGIDLADNGQLLQENPV